MNTKKILTISLASTVLLAGSLVFAGSALAQENSFQPFNFKERLAQILGIDENKLEDAFKQVNKEKIDYLVENGRLDEEIAQKRKEAIDNGEFGFGNKFRGQQGGLKRRGREMIKDLADYLNASEEEIIDELKNGKSIEDVVNDNGKDIEEVKEYLKTKAESRIDELVDSGELDEDRAQNIKENLDEMIDRFLTNDHDFSAKGPRGFRMAR